MNRLSTLLKSRFGLKNLAFLQCMTFDFDHVFRLHRIEGILQRLLTKIRRNKFGLAVFFVPLVIRAIPEILSGPYPVGFDTVAFYSPNVIDWVRGTLSPWNDTGPLMYLFAAPTYALTGINPFEIFRTIGPILYGGLAWATFRFAKRVMRWESKTAFTATILVSLLLPSLRLGWDGYRTELGLVFFLLALSNEEPSDPRRLMTYTILTVLAVLSNELVAALTIGSQLRLTLQAKSVHLKTRFAILAPSSVIAIGSLLVMLRSPFGPGVTNTGVPNGYLLVSESVFALFLFWPVLPLVIAGFRSSHSGKLSLWVFICCIGVLASALPGHVLQDIGYRWILLLTIPIAFTGYQGYEKIRDKLTHAGRMKLLAMTRIGLVMLIIAMSIPFLTTTSETALPYYSSFTSFFPSSMIQSSIPSHDAPVVVSIMSHLSGLMGPADVLVVNQCFYGWAREYLPPDKNVVSSSASSTDSLLPIVTSYRHVFTVWWLPGAGWYEAATPHAAIQTAIIGDLAIYQYR